MKYFVYIVEFHQRGSPHIHSLVWIENAPTLERSSREEIEQFVDNELTCNADNEETVSLVHLQTHKHSRNCAERRENQYVDLDFQFFPFQEPCYIRML